MPQVNVPGTQYYISYPDDWSQDQINQDMQSKVQPFIAKSKPRDLYGMGAPYVPEPQAAPAPPAPSFSDLWHAGIPSFEAGLANIASGGVRMAQDLADTADQYGDPRFGLLSGLVKNPIVGGIGRAAQDIATAKEKEAAPYEQGAMGKLGAQIGGFAPLVAAGFIPGVGPELSAAGFFSQAYNDQANREDEFEKESGVKLDPGKRLINAAIPAVAQAALGEVFGAATPELQGVLGNLIKGGEGGLRKRALAKLMVNTGKNALEMSAYNAASKFGPALYDPKVVEQLGLSGTEEEREKNLAKTFESLGQDFWDNLPIGGLMTGVSAALARKPGGAEEPAAPTKGQLRALPPGHPMRELPGGVYAMPGDVPPTGQGLLPEAPGEGEPYTPGPTPYTPSGSPRLYAETYDAEGRPIPQLPEAEGEGEPYTPGPTPPPQPSGAPGLYSESYDADRVYPQLPEAEGEGEPYTPTDVAARQQPGPWPQLPSESFDVNPIGNAVYHYNSADGAKPNGQRLLEGTQMPVPLGQTYINDNQGPIPMQRRITAPEVDSVRDLGQIINRRGEVTDVPVQQASPEMTDETANVLSQVGNVDPRSPGTQALARVLATRQSALGRSMTDVENTGSLLLESGPGGTTELLDPVGELARLSNDPDRADLLDDAGAQETVQRAYAHMAGLDLEDEEQAENVRGDLGEAGAAPANMDPVTSNEPDISDEEFVRRLEERAAAAERGDTGTKTGAEQFREMLDEIEARIAAERGEGPAVEHTQKAREIFTGLLKDLGFDKHVSLKFHDFLNSVRESFAEGKSWKDPDGLVNILLGAHLVDPNDPSQGFSKILPIFDHEMVHAMRSLKMFSPREWKTLLSRSRSIRYEDEFGNPRTIAGQAVHTPWDLANYLYWDRLKHIDEEAVAMMFTDMTSGILPKTVAYNGMAGKVRRLFHGVRRLMDGQSWYSAEDLYKHYTSGKIGQEFEARQKRNTKAWKQREQATGAAYAKNPRYVDLSDGDYAKKARERIHFRPEDERVQQPGVDANGNEVRTSGWLPFLKDPDGTQKQLRQIYLDAIKFADEKTGGKMSSYLKRRSPALKEGEAWNPTKSYIFKKFPKAAAWDEYLRGPMVNRYFYERMRQLGNILQLGPDAMRTQGHLISVTSPRQKPTPNFMDATAMHSQWLRKRPVSVGVLSEQPVRRLFRGEGGFMPKVSTFADTLLYHAGLSDKIPLTTNDMHVAQIFGFKPGEMDTGDNALHIFSQRVHEEIARMQNEHAGNAPGDRWSWEQVQSAAWSNKRKGTGDDYLTAARKAQQLLFKAKILNKVIDPVTGEKVIEPITLDTLLHPGTAAALRPKLLSYLRAPRLTTEIGVPDKLHDDAKALLDKLPDDHPLRKDIEEAVADAHKALPGVAKKLAQSFYQDLGGSVNKKAKELLTRIVSGQGTWDRKVAQNIQIPFHALPKTFAAKVWHGMISALGRGLKQEGIGHTTFRVIDDPKEKPNAHGLYVPNHTFSPEEVAQFTKRLGRELTITPSVSGDVLHTFANKAGSAKSGYAKPGELERVAKQILGEKEAHVVPLEAINVGFRDQADYETHPEVQDLAARAAAAGGPQSVGGYLDTRQDESGLTELEKDYRGRLERAVAAGREQGHIPKLKTDEKMPNTHSGDIPSAAWAIRRPNFDVRRRAEEYKRKAGIDKKPLADEVPVSVPLLKRVADVFEEAAHQPDEPETAAAYKALRDETIAQFQHLGVHAEPYYTGGEPYRNSEAMLDDVQHNSHLWYFPTESGFGSEGAISEGRTNPMLERTEEKDSAGNKLLVNDIFRIVHDYFGHGQNGFSFGPKGELNAYLEHSRMYSDEAKSALAAETLAQNAWVNYGPHMRRADGSTPERSDPDFVPLDQRAFADQKNFAVPKQVLDDVDAYAEGKGAAYAKRRPAFDKNPAWTARKKKLVQLDEDEDPADVIRNTVLNPGWLRKAGQGFYRKGLNYADYINQVRKREGIGKPMAKDDAAAYVEGTGHLNNISSSMFNKGGGAPTMEGGYLHHDGKGSLLDAFAPVLGNPEKRSDLSAYLVLRRNFNLLQSRSKDAFQYLKRGADGKLVPDDDARQFDMSNMLRVEQENPEFRRMFNEVHGVNSRNLDFAQDTGLVDQATKENYLKYQDYIPFRSLIDDESDSGLGGTRALANQTTQLHDRMRGADSWQPLQDPLRAYLDNHLNILNAGYRNLAGQKARDFFTGVMHTDGKPIVEEVPSGYKPKRGEQTFHLYEKGKRKYYVTRDPIAFDLFRKTQEIASMHPLLDKLLGQPTRLLQLGATKNPGFVLPMIMRHALAATATTGGGPMSMAKGMAEVFKILPGMWKHDGPNAEIARKLMAAGIGGGNRLAFSSDSMKAAEQRLAIEEWKKQPTAEKIKNFGPGLRAALDTYERKIEELEMAPRVQVYNAALKRTNDPVQALYEANDIMPFNKRGSSQLVGLATRAIPFINARAQGINQMIQAAMGEGPQAAYGPGDAAARKKALMKSTLMNAALLAGVTGVYYALSRNQEYYNTAHDPVRDNNWLIPMPGGGALKVPTPFEFGLFTKTIPERILRMLDGKDTPQEAGWAAARQIGESLTFDPIPQAVKPALEAMTNYDLQTGRPIVDPGLQELEPDYQFQPTTSLLSKFAAQHIINPAMRALIPNSLGISPMKLDKLITGYTGLGGLYTLQFIDSLAHATGATNAPAMRLLDYPVVSRFFTEKNGSELMSQFYAVQGMVDQAVKTMAKIPEEDRQKFYDQNQNLLAASDFVNDLGKQMREYRAQEHQVMASAALTPEQKREYLDQLRQGEIDLLQPLPLLKQLARTGKID